AVGVLDLSAIILTQFHGIVAGFDEGEKIKVANAASASLNGTASTLTIYDGSNQSLGTITLSGTYTGDTFNVDGSGFITVIDLVATLSSNDPRVNVPINVSSITDDGVAVSTGLTFQWLVDGQPATGSGATTAAYTPVTADLG